MNVKVVVVILVAFVVAVGLVLFYGALRPNNGADDAQKGVGGSLGWLVPSRILTFDDVQDAACARPDTLSLVVAPGTRCTVPLPSPSEIYLCSDQPTSLSVRTKGDDYPEQRVDTDHLSCTTAQRIPIYDTATILTVRCLGLTTCAVRIVEPPGD